MGEKFGYHHGKADLERIGLFAEMEYMHGKGYTAPVANTNIRDMKLAQMFPGFPKWKTDLQDCYFDQKFKRIFEKEAYSTPYIIEAKAQKELKKKYPNQKPFIPPPPPKKHATPGDYFGTIGGPVKAFSPVLRPRMKTEKMPPNIRTSPGKKGGPGYPDICINKYPPYKSSPYDDPKATKKEKGKYIPFLGGFPPSYFDKNPYLTKNIKATYKEEFEKRETKYGPFYPPTFNKTLDGCFDKYPEYKSPVGANTKKEKKKTDSIVPFRPQPQNKTMYTRSIMANKIDIAVNSQNWRNFKPITYTKEFLV